MSERGKLAWGLVLLIAILHYDFWYWNDRTLLFGFLPVGLGYHALFSLACGTVWFLAIRFAWPSHVEEWADELEGERPANRGDRFYVSALARDTLTPLVAEIERRLWRGSPSIEASPVGEEAGDEPDEESEREADHPDGREEDADS